MATILLAMGDTALRDVFVPQLRAAGQHPIVIERALAVLSLAPMVTWDVVCVDGSALGRETIATLVASGQSHAPIVGLGFQDAAVAASLPLPLVAQDLIATIDRLTSLREQEHVEDHLELDPFRRLAILGEREVALTRTEFRLLEVLQQRQPHEVALPDVLESVWGFSEGLGTSELVRAHVRNLRQKLAEIGLPDAVRSRRGRGYALASLLSLSAEPASR